jgi:hypothetical protein
MPMVTGVPDARTLLKDVGDLQSAMFDKASNYTKLILGLGYAGFFTVWSGTKSHLSARALVWSALLVTVSLILYIVFEVCQAFIISYLAIQFANSVSASESNVALALSKYKDTARKWLRPLLAAWIAIFPISALTGLGGAGILIFGFIRSLRHI